jgi:2,3-bisphosphoglycerate-independent phosphoglycerate mutase
LTELETAQKPHLDKLARNSICGLQHPVALGVTPGSGPAHLALFGYDPTHYKVGRGVLSALGIDFDLTDQDVAARGNFCTIDEEGRVTDRRAGRISTEKSAELCKLLEQIELPGVQLFIKPEKEYRFVLVLRGEGLSGDITDSDPQEVNQSPLQPKPLSGEAEKTAWLVNEFLTRAYEILQDHHPANMVLLRGFAQRPHWPTVSDVFGVKAAAIAAYPMYRGVAKLVGMEVLDVEDDVKKEFELLEVVWQKFDFFYLHVKRIDSAGEDGNFERKVNLIEAVDAQLPRLINLNPDVIIITGDHSTPSYLRYHSWHPVPVLLWSKYCRADRVEQFGERACMAGGLGPNLPRVNLMPLALANALRLEKFGA